MNHTVPFGFTAGCVLLWLAACSDPAPDAGSTTPATPAVSIGKQQDQQGLPDRSKVEVQASATFRADNTIGAQQLGMPLYPNAELIKSGTWDIRDPEQGSEALTSLKLRSQDPLNKVVAFYRAQTKNAQFIEINRPGGKRVSVTLSLPDQTTTSAVLRETASGTSIEITKLGRGDAAGGQ